MENLGLHNSQGWEEEARKMPKNRRKEITYWSYLVYIQFSLAYVHHGLNEKWVLVSSGEMEIANLI